MGTKITPFNLHTSVDSHVKGLIDSSFVQARTSAGTDSAATQAMIDSSISFQVDSAYVLARAPAGTDSSSIQAMIDSNFAHDITFGGAAGTQAYTFDGSDVILDSTSAVFFDKSDKSLKFGDDYKAKFGASGDLEIYHDTVNGNSVIHDNGSGNLRIRADDFQVTNAAASANLIFANDGNGEVKLYHNGSEKIATTSGGATLTGALTTSGNIELGHASDTTLARSSAGVVTIEGVEITTNSATQTLTNKTLTDPVIHTHLDIIDSANNIAGGLRIGPDSNYPEKYEFSLDSAGAGNFNGYWFKIDNTDVMQINAQMGPKYPMRLYYDLDLHTDADIRFQGSTAATHETTLTVQDASDFNKTITLPNLHGRINELLISYGSMNTTSLVFNSSTLGGYGDYSELRLVLTNCKPSTQTGVYMRVGSSNSGDGGTNYGQAYYVSGYYASATAYSVSYVDHDATYFVLADNYAQLGTGTGQNGHFEITFLNPNTSSHYKLFKINSQIYSYYPMLMGRYIDAAVWKSTAAINYIQVYPGSGNLALEYKLYGVKS